MNLTPKLYAAAVERWDDSARKWKPHGFTYVHGVDSANANYQYQAGLSPEERENTRLVAIAPAIGHLESAKLIL